MDINTYYKLLQQILSIDKLPALIIGCIIGAMLHNYIIVKPAQENRSAELKIKEMEHELEIHKYDQITDTYDMLDTFLNDLKYDKEQLVDDIEGILDDISSERDTYNFELGACRKEKIPKNDCEKANEAQNQIDKHEQFLNIKKQQLQKKDERIDKVSGLMISLRLENRKK